MHTATCEAFLESVAKSREGVSDAEASYVTETIRVAHDPDRISKAELRNALSRLGYTAYLRDEVAEDEHDAGSTRRAREVGGVRKRRSEDILGMRYVVGMVFGSFLLLPYVVFLYPYYLASVVDWGFLQLYASSLGFGGAGGVSFLRLYFGLTGIVLLFTGLPVLRGAYVSIKMGRPNTDLLVAITVVCAYVYSTAAVLVGRTDVYFDLTLVVAAAVTAAVFYESSVKQRGLDRLTDLTTAQVATARLYESDGTTRDVPAEDVRPGDRVLVRPGERIPVDGVLEEGPCTVDEAVVTGESVPIVKRDGDDVIGGAIVTAGSGVIAASDRATSSIDRLVESVWTLQSATHGVQRRADRLATLVVPALLAVALLAAAGSLALGGEGHAPLLSLLVALVVACPWALGLATPLSVASSLEQALKRGIVVFDETVFERLRDVDVVVFDKTGTLTSGRMAVVDADAPPELLEAAAALERRAKHPAAEAIVAAFGDEPDPDSARTDGGRGDAGAGTRARQVQEFTTHSTGVEGTVDGVAVLVGHVDLFVERGWKIDDDLRDRVDEERGVGRLPVVVGRDGRAEGIVVVGDEPRDGWDDTITRLSERDIDVVVLTGDDESATEHIGRHPDVDQVFAGVPPEGKTATIRQLARDRQVAMVGDGTNDAPALAAADLGLSMGSGTALAADAADVAIVDDDLESVETAFDLAFAARRRVRQNVGLALLYNAVLIPVAAVGLLNPFFSMVGAIITSGLLGLNSVRELVDD